MRNGRNSSARWIAPALAASVAAAACGPDSAPTAVRPSPRVVFDVSAADAQSDRYRLSAYLYQTAPALARQDRARIDTLGFAGDNSALSCAVTGRILNQLLTSYSGYVLFGQAADQYGGPYLTRPRPQVQEYIRALSPACGRIAPANGVPDAALDVGGGIGFISAADGGNVETVPSSVGQAGVRVQPSTFPVDVLLAIQPLAASAALPTTLPQVAPYYDVTVTPAQSAPYSKPVDVGLRVDWPGLPPSDHLLLGHNAPVGGMEVLQPICLTTPTAGVGTFGGPAYLRPRTGCPTGTTSPAVLPAGTAGVVALAAVKGTTTNVAGQASSLSPFGLVYSYQSGVNPNAAVVFGQGYCAYGGAVPYTVTSASDIIVNYQELGSGGALIGARRTLFLAGVRSGDSPRYGTVYATSVQTRSIRFYYGSVLFATRTVPSCSE